MVRDERRRAARRVGGGRRRGGRCRRTRATAPPSYLPALLARATRRARHRLHRALPQPRAEPRVDPRRRGPRAIACRVYNEINAELYGPYADRMTAVGDPARGHARGGDRRARVRGRHARREGDHARATCAAACRGSHAKLRSSRGWRSASTRTASTATTTTTRSGSACVDLGVAVGLHASRARLGQPALGEPVRLQPRRLLRRGGRVAREVAVPRRRHPPLPRRSTSCSSKAASRGAHPCSPTSSATGRSATATRIGELDPARLDVDEVVGAVRGSTARRVTRAISTRCATSSRAPSTGPTTSTTGARAASRRVDDFRVRFVDRFYFGCEADDPMNASAFNARGNALGARLQAVFGSDMGHWDVRDLSGILVEAHELVDDGLITDADFRDFAFTNPARLYAQGEPRLLRRHAVCRRGPYAGDDCLTRPASRRRDRTARLYDHAGGSGWGTAIGHRHGDVHRRRRVHRAAPDLGDDRADDLRRAHDALVRDALSRARRHRGEGVGRRLHDRVRRPPPRPSAPRS